MKITKIEKYKKHEGARNRHEHYWKTEHDIYDRKQNRIQLHFGEPNKGVTNLKTPTEKG